MVLLKGLQWFFAGGRVLGALKRTPVLGGVLVKLVGDMVAVF